MNFSALSIKNPIPAILLFILLTLAGLIAYRGLNVQDFPDIELPMITISAGLEGAAPAQLETEVARKLENSVASLSGVKNTYTTIIDGSVTVVVEFVLEKDSNVALDDVRNAVSTVKADLPADVRDPVVSKLSTAGRPVITYALTSTQMSEESLSWFIDNDVSKRVLNVEGVGGVRRLGGVSREISVTLDANKINAMGVTAAEISQRLRQVQQESPSGRGDVAGAEQSVRTVATLKSADEIGALSIPLNDGRSIRLDEVATVADSTAERGSIVLLNGKPVVAFEVMRSKGASEVGVAAGVEAQMAELSKSHPEVVQVKAIDNSTPVAENFKGSMELLYEGAFLAVIVVFWFLRDWRATFVAATALPLSIIPAFLGLQYFGFTLNTVTLLSMALVVGILVDDAIVEIENITRHIQMGKSPFAAAMEAADEIGLAVIATTFALVSVFLPTAFMSGIAGKFFKQFGWTAVLAILASLLVARLLTPMMSAYLLKPKNHETKPDGALMQAYMRSVKWCLGHRKLTLLYTSLFFVGSIAIVPLLPSGFVPPSDRAQTMVNVELAPGATLEQTLQASEQARLKLMELPQVESVFNSVGAGVSGNAFAPGSAGQARKATLTVILSHRDDRSLSQQDVEALIREKLSSEVGVRMTVGAQDSGVKMQLVLQSENADALAQASQDLERDLRTLKGIGNVTSSASLVQPEIIVRPNNAQAANLGVTTDAIGETLRIATAGDYQQALAKLNLPERQVPIRVRFDKDTRSDLGALGRLSIPSSNGPVMLNQIATLSINSGPAQIDRLNRSRNVNFDIELNGRELGDVDKEAKLLNAYKNLPEGVSIKPFGDAEEQGKLFSSFILAMGIGVLCIYMVLVLLFKDFMQPVTILAALPLSFGGAFVLLLLTNKSFSMPSLIGLLMLMGVVTKNSILLVDYAILARKAGMARWEALVDACHKRVRPIVMTTIAMGAGMLPLALGMGADPSFRSPMAVAVIGGLVTSTLLSLLVIPVVFTFVDDFELWLKKRFGRKH